MHFVVNFEFDIIIRNDNAKIHKLVNDLKNKSFTCSGRKS